MSELPIELQMEIQVSALRHKREIAEGFAKLRAKLLPPIPEPVEAQMQRMLLNDFSRFSRYNGLAASQQGLNWASLPYPTNALYRPQASILGAPHWWP